MNVGGGKWIATFECRIDLEKACIRGCPAQDGTLTGAAGMKTEFAGQIHCRSVNDVGRIAFIRTGGRFSQRTIPALPKESIGSDFCLPSEKVKRPVIPAVGPNTIRVQSMGERVCCIICDCVDGNRTKRCTQEND